ncbi:MAG: ABC transporter substrate-binding protein [Syntrophales bacterium]|jgi:iron complex transport system substrate-binding protein|nr:ABC transporter substrate-binding protein [Syntrophales bacterium]
MIKDKWNGKRYFVIISYCLTIFVLFAGTAHAREITDMAGRKVIVPDVINRVVAPSPYGFAMLYSVAPEKIAGLMSPWKEEDKKFVHPAVHDLPVIGRGKDTDALVKANPDVIIVWGDKHNPIHQASEEKFGKLGIPYVYVTVGDLADLPDYPAAYAFLGDLLGKQDHTAKEAAYCRRTLDEVAATMKDIPRNERPRVYLAEGPDGLKTECDDSLHVHLLRLAGDVNVHRCHTSCHVGMEPVTLEQVVLYNPDVILVQDKGFFDKVSHDPAWSGIKAVKEGRVYLIPKVPFNWFDRPPSFMRILGLKWVMSCLYPKQYKVDLIRETQAFYRLFLGVTLSADDAAKIISP